MSNMTVLNFPAALMELQRNWTVEDFRLCLAFEADEWAAIGQGRSRDWETCKPIDQKEAQDCRRMAELAMDEAHHARAPFAWTGYYVTADARISDLFRAWLEGLKREAAYFEEPVNARARLEYYREELPYLRHARAT